MAQATPSRSEQNLKQGSVVGSSQTSSTGQRPPGSTPGRGERQGEGGGQGQVGGQDQGGIQGEDGGHGQDRGQCQGEGQGQGQDRDWVIKQGQGECQDQSWTVRQVQAEDRGRAQGQKGSQMHEPLVQIISFLSPSLSPQAFVQQSSFQSANPCSWPGGGIGHEHSVASLHALTQARSQVPPVTFMQQGITAKRAEEGQHGGLPRNGRRRGGWFRRGRKQNAGGAGESNTSQSLLTVPTVGTNHPAQICVSVGQPLTQVSQIVAGNKDDVGKKGVGTAGSPSTSTGEIVSTISHGLASPVLSLIQKFMMNFFLKKNQFDNTITAQDKPEDSEGDHDMSEEISLETCASSGMNERKESDSRSFKKPLFNNQSCFCYGTSETDSLNQSSSCIWKEQKRNNEEKDEAIFRSENIIPISNKSDAGSYDSEAGSEVIKDRLCVACSKSGSWIDEEDTDEIGFGDPTSCQQTKAIHSRGHGESYSGGHDVRSLPVNYPLLGLGRGQPNFGTQEVNADVETLWETKAELGNSQNALGDTAQQNQFGDPITAQDKPEDSEGDHDMPEDISGETCASSQMNEKKESDSRSFQKPLCDDQTRFCYETSERDSLSQSRSCVWEEQKRDNEEEDEGIFRSSNVIPRGNNSDAGSYDSEAGSEAIKDRIDVAGSKSGSWIDEEDTDEISFGDFTSFQLIRAIRSRGRGESHSRGRHTGSLAATYRLLGIGRGLPYLGTQQVNADVETLWRTRAAPLRSDEMMFEDCDDSDAGIRASKDCDIQIADSEFGSWIDLEDTDEISFGDPTPYQQTRAIHSRGRGESHSRGRDVGSLVANYPLLGTGRGRPNFGTQEVNADVETMRGTKAELGNSQNALGDTAQQNQFGDPITAQDKPDDSEGDHDMPEDISGETCASSQMNEKKESDSRSFQKPLCDDQTRFCYETSERDSLSQSRSCVWEEQKRDNEEEDEGIFRSSNVIPRGNNSDAGSYDSEAGSEAIKDRIDVAGSKSGSWIDEEDTDEISFGDFTSFQQIRAIRSRGRGESHSRGRHTGSLAATYRLLGIGRGLPYLGTQQVNADVETLWRTRAAPLRSDEMMFEDCDDSDAGIRASKDCDIQIADSEFGSWIDLEDTDEISFGDPTPYQQTRAIHSRGRGESHSRGRDVGSLVANYPLLGTGRGRPNFGTQEVNADVETMRGTKAELGNSQNALGDTAQQNQFGDPITAQDKPEDSEGDHDMPEHISGKTCTSSRMKERKESDSRSFQKPLCNDQACFCYETSERDSLSQSSSCVWEEQKRNNEEEDEGIFRSENINPRGNNSDAGNYDSEAGSEVIKDRLYVARSKSGSWIDEEDTDEISFRDFTSFQQIRARRGRGESHSRGRGIGSLPANYRLLGLGRGQPNFRTREVNADVETWWGTKAELGNSQNALGDRAQQRRTAQSVTLTEERKVTDEPEQQKDSNQHRGQSDRSKSSEDKKEQKTSNSKMVEGDLANSNLLPVFKVDQNLVIEYLVNHHKGSCTLFEVQKNSGIFPCTLQPWDVLHSLGFCCFIRVLIDPSDLENSTVKVDMKKLRLCVEYRPPKGCSRNNCQYIHLCREFIMDCCFSWKCILGHDVESEHNMKILIECGIEIFSADQKLSLIRCSNLLVCREHNRLSSCPVPKSCFKIHVCNSYILNNCVRPPGRCPYGHDLFSERNRKILRLYEVDQLKVNFLLRLVFCFHNELFNKGSSSGMREQQKAFAGRTKPEEDNKRYFEREQVSGSLVTEQKVINTGASLDESVESYKSEKHSFTFSSQQKPHLPKLCGISRLKSFEEHTCDQMEYCIDRHGSQTPYLWRVRMYSNWFNLENNELIEEEFSNPEAEKFWGTMWDMTVCIDFSSMKSEVGVVQRLSTPSYVVCSDKIDATKWLWYWLDFADKWVLYGQNNEPPYQDVLEAKFLNDSRHVCCFEINGCKYELDFAKMEQRNLKTNFCRPVRRRPFYRNRDAMEMPCTEYHYDKSKVPFGWVPMDTESKHGMELVPLHLDDAYYETIKCSFFSTLRATNFEIQRIYRLQNLDLLQSFQMKKILMEKKTGSEVEEVNVYHGTPEEETVRWICSLGFDQRMHGRHGSKYGTGVYFATTAEFSHCYTQPSERGIRYMFRARVLVGRTVEGKCEYRRPPPIDPRKPTEGLYDTCVNSIAEPSIYVVFDNNQSYPEYLIEYRDVDAISEADDYQRHSSFATTTSHASHYTSPQFYGAPRLAAHRPHFASTFYPVQSSHLSSPGDISNQFHGPPSSFMLPPGYSPPCASSSGSETWSAGNSPYFSARQPGPSFFHRKPKQ